MFFFSRFPKRVAAPRRGVKFGFLGGAGAPKFLKNWLHFAHSPYDPDHKSPSGGPLWRVSREIFKVLFFLRSHENMGIILNIV